ncbi:hypothetical protein TA3x_000893 [Tundrisphaera sp. TA3]|uniref:hypothetical protein n=1 Tax=Tundrisphaera sp. TA3 TaxID=3435775 RepID=UPI003EBC8CE1
MRSWRGSASVTGWISLSVAALLSVPGCSQDARTKVYAVQGKVFFKGAPASGGFVVFHPAAAGTDATLPTAPVKSDGSFQLTTYENNDGAPAGEYAVTVQWNRPIVVNKELQSGPNVIPAKYSDPAKTPLKVTVAQAANDLKPFEITK